MKNKWTQQLIHQNCKKLNWQKIQIKIEKKINNFNKSNKKMKHKETEITEIIKEIMTMNNRINILNRRINKTFRIKKNLLKNKLKKIVVKMIVKWIIMNRDQIKEIMEGEVINNKNHKIFKKNRKMHNRNKNKMMLH